MPGGSTHVSVCTKAVTAPVTSGHNVCFSRRVYIYFKLLQAFHYLQVGHEYKSWYEYAPSLDNIRTQRLENLDKERVTGNLKSTRIMLVDFTLSIFAHFQEIFFQKPNSY